MVRKFFLIGCLILVGLAACADEEAPQPTEVLVAQATDTTVPLSQTPSPTHTLLPSLTPTPEPSSTPQPTETATPTFTPTPTLSISVYAQTPVPSHQQQIEPENVQQVTELAQWGRGVINDLAISEDGRWLAVGTATGVYIHDTEDLSKTVYHLKTPLTVESIAISPDGDMVAVNLTGDLVQLWDVNANEIIYEIVIVTANVHFSPSGEYIILNNADGVHIVQAINGEIIQTYPDTFWAQFSPDTEQLAVWHYNSLSLYSWPDNSLVRQIKPLSFIVEDGREFGSAIGGVQFMSGGEFLMSALPVNPAYGTTGDILIQQGSDGSLLYHIDAINALSEPINHACNEPNVFADPPGKPQPWQMELSSNEQLMAFVFRGARYGDGITIHTSVRFYQRDSGLFLYGVEQGIDNIVMSPMNDTWIASLQDGRLQIRSVNDGSVLDSTNDYDAPALKTAVSPDNNLVAVEYQDEVKIFRAENGEVLYRYPAQHAAFAPDGETVALGYEDGRLEIRDLSDDQLLRTINGHTEGVTAVTYLPDGGLVSAGLDCGFHVWNPADVELINTFENLIVDSIIQGERVAVRIWNLAVFQNEFLLGDLSGKFGIWEVDSGALLYLLDIPNYSENIAAFEDSVVLAGSPMKFGKLTAEGQFIMLWEGNHAIEAVTISPDGKIIISGTGGSFSNPYRNGSLHFWLPDNGYLIHEMMPVTDKVTGLAFAPNGRFFVSTTLDGVVRLWGIPES